MDYPLVWDRIRQRYEAWWEGEMLDRPMVRVTAPLRNCPDALPPQDQAGLVNWYTDPDQVLPRLERRMENTYYAGDAFPWIDPMSQNLAAIQAAYMGAPYTIDPSSQSGWAVPSFEEWNRRPRFTPDDDNFWWQATRRLLERGAERSKDHFVISIPDLQGGGEILALLRGSDRLAMDLLDHPQEIVPAIDEINTAWYYYYQVCYEIIHRWQEGYVDWLGIWSQTPAVTVECDFMVMISRGMFEQFFLPAVEQQCEWIERTVFHLDGPGAVKHLDMLLAIPRLKGIQWVPTPERPRPSDWIPLLQRIQAGGKRVVAACAPDEVMPLLDALRPEGVMLSTSCQTPREAEALIRMVENKYGLRR
jgi:hypothetical protein